MPPSPAVIILVADGARPDVLAAAMQSGRLPSLARLREEGSLRTITSVFPSVTGPAYAPFLVGLHPGSVGLPGLRWFDRARTVRGAHAHARSYVGPEMRLFDDDLDPAAQTMFELAQPSVGALSVIRRGLSQHRQIGRGAAFIARTAVTHFGGNVRGWLDIDRDIGNELVKRVRDERPRFAFAAFTGIDKTSHADGHNAPSVIDAMSIVDDVAGSIRDDCERDGTWQATQLWVVSDHGHSSIARHEDLASYVASLGHRVLAHPWVFTRNADVAVMVSGNAMAHVYTGLEDRERRFWGDLAPRWSGVADGLLARDSVDLLLLPLSRSSCEVRARGRGAAVVTWNESAYSYQPGTGDPLGIGACCGIDATAAYDITIDSDYPDALVQIARLTECSRSGDIIISAARDWDFRAKYEPIPHVSSHGALHREHMLVPLLTNHPIAGTARRTVDVMASACVALSIVAQYVQGTSFL